MKVLLKWRIESNFENHDIRSVKVQETMAEKHDRGINCSNLLTLEEYEKRIGTLEGYLKKTNTTKGMFRIDFIMIKITSMSLRFFLYFLIYFICLYNYYHYN